MTTQEHALMIGIFAVQLETIQALVNILQSRGVIDDDDVKAFSAIRSLDERQKMAANAGKVYARIAQTVGIDPVAVGILP